MAPATQQALILESKFSHFAIRTIEVPKPGVGEVLVKVQSAALNPIDWKIQKYGLFVQDFPAVLGSDMAGDVVEVGEGVSGFEVGDKVFFQGSLTIKTGGFQQYAIAQYPFIAKIPHNLTYDDVSTLPVTALTGYLALFHNSSSGFGLPNVLVEGRNKPIEQGIVILGGPSQVGQFAIQWAKLSGFSYIITTASLKHTDYLKSLGATNVIDRNASLDAVSSELSKITGSPRIKYVIDSIGVSETQQLGYDLLSADGEIALVLPDAIKNKVEGKKVHSLAAFVTIPSNHEVGAIFYKHITTLLEEGAIKPTPLEVLPRGLDGITDGLKRLENNQVSGIKLVARPQET